MSSPAATRASPRYVACLTALLAVATLLVSACVPQMRIAWSADGQQALVCAADGLHLMTPDGKLSPLLLPKAHWAAWTGPDTALVSYDAPVKTWAEAKALLTPDDANLCEDLGESLLRQLRRAKGHGSEALAALGQSPLGQVECAAAMPVLLYAVDRDRQLVVDRIGLKDVNEGLAGATLGELAQVHLAGGKLTVLTRLAAGGQTLFAALNPMFDWVLFTQKRLGHQDVSLGVVPLGGGAIHWLSDGVKEYADWSVDGRAIVGVAQSGPADSATALGEVHRFAVLSADGDLEADPPSSSDDTLAAVLAPAAAPLRVLPDGRVLFVSAAATLPAKDLEPAATLYVIPASGGAPRPVLAEVDGKAFPVEAFAVSPDQTRIAVFAGGQVGVARIDGPLPAQVAVSPVAANGDSEMIPAWRGNSQLTFEVSGAAGAPGQERQVVLSTLDWKTTVLSGTWPRDAWDGWLNKGPATQAARPEATQPGAGRGKTP